MLVIQSHDHTFRTQRDLRGHLDYGSHFTDYNMKSREIVTCPLSGLDPSVEGGEGTNHDWAPTWAVLSLIHLFIYGCVGSSLLRTGFV